MSSGQHWCAAQRILGATVLAAIGVSITITGHKRIWQNPKEHLAAARALKCSTASTQRHCGGVAGHQNHQDPLYQDRGWRRLS